MGESRSPQEEALGQGLGKKNGRLPAEKPAARPVATRRDAGLLDERGAPRRIVVAVDNLELLVTVVRLRGVIQSLDVRYGSWYLCSLHVFNMVWQLPVCFVGYALMLLYRLFGWI